MILSETLEFISLSIVNTVVLSACVVIALNVMGISQKYIDKLFRYEFNRRIILDYVMQLAKAVGDTLYAFVLLVVLTITMILDIPLRLFNCGKPVLGKIVERIKYNALSKQLELEEYDDDKTENNH